VGGLLLRWFLCTVSKESTAKDSYTIKSKLYRLDVSLKAYSICLVGIYDKQRIYYTGLRSGSATAGINQLQTHHAALAKASMPTRAASLAPPQELLPRLLQLDLS